MSDDSSVKVAVRIRPLSEEEELEDKTLCVNKLDEQQIVAGTDYAFTFDYAFGPDAAQSHLYETCVVDLLHAAFEGFNATILAYGQTGSGKTWTMGSGSVADVCKHSTGVDTSYGIIPRVIHDLFDMIQQKETDDPASTYRVHVQFLEIYGEDIRDLLDPTKTSKVTIRETAGGEVFVSGAREEVVSSAAQMMKTLDDGTRHRMTASTLMNVSSSRSHAIFTVFIEHTIHTLAVTTAGDVVDNAGGSRKSGDEGALGTDASAAVALLSDGAAAAAAAAATGAGVIDSKEIRRCKFTFVDLAGSERAKRSGAQGLQLKEGIDINKGLLALGNVISALGDDTKRGKVHVPYRVSKITRILQDSLGGNSKTLMICCVSPSGPSFYESLNALRYANRARNIQNKPVVNRDPTLILIDELKLLVVTMADELLKTRRGERVEGAVAALSEAELEAILASGGSYRVDIQAKVQRKGGDEAAPGGPGAASRLAPTRRSGSSSQQLPLAGSASAAVRTTASAPPLPAATQKEVAALARRGDEAEFEVRRLTEQLKLARTHATELSERVILVQSERDFYAHKWAEACPDEAKALRRPDGAAFPTTLSPSPGKPSPGLPGDGDEKDKMAAFAAQYLREIETLRQQLAVQTDRLASARESSVLFDAGQEAELVETELSANVAQVIAQTERQLLEEGRRLRSLGAVGQGRRPSGTSDGSDDEDFPTSPTYSAGPLSPYDGPSADDHGPIVESQLEADEQAYQRRKRLMNDEVVAIGEQLQMKETLLGQLRRSQHQYSVMKAFYEQKLTALSEEMEGKQAERDRLMQELHDLERNTSKLEHEASRQKNNEERRLRMQLQKKDEELRLLKRRQEELSNLAKVQARYQSQVVRLESDIDNMRKQKVELTKSLQAERKRHFAMLTVKAREVDRLRHELMVTASEAKRLSRDKLRAEERAKEAMKDSAAMRKRVQDQRYGGAGAAESQTLASRQTRRLPVKSGVSKPAMTEEELRVKKWLDRRLQDITAREEATEALRQQCEQQMALMHKKEALVKEKENLRSAVNLRDVITRDGAAGAAPDGAPAGLTQDEEEALQELQDRLDSVEGQLRLRHRDIAAIESQLSLADEAALPENTLEALKSRSAASLPAAHEVIRLLFDMLVAAKSMAQQRRVALNRAAAKERLLRIDLDEAASRTAAMMRAHDTELTRVANEYEEKLQGLFTHSAMGQLVFQESGMQPPGSPQSPSAGKSAGILDRGSPQSPSVVRGSPAFFGTPDGTEGSGVVRHRSRTLNTLHGDVIAAAVAASGGSAQAQQPTDMRTAIMLEVAVEQTKLLRTRLDREATRNNYLNECVAELDNARQVLTRELEEMAIHVRFLEDERQLFKDMADDLRASASATAAGYVAPAAKPGQKVGAAGPGPGRRPLRLEDLRGTASSAAAAAAAAAGGEDDDEDEETDSVLGAFDTLGDVIRQTGSVPGAPPFDGRDKSPPRPGGAPGVAGAALPPGVYPSTIYDRLTNPSNFTGAMKNVFKQDLAQKRHKVQLIKSGQFTRKDKDSPVGFVFLNAKDARNMFRSQDSDPLVLTEHFGREGSASGMGSAHTTGTLTVSTGSGSGAGSGAGGARGRRGGAGGDDDAAVEAKGADHHHHHAMSRPPDAPLTVNTALSPIPPSTPHGADGDAGPPTADTDLTYALSPRAFELTDPRDPYGGGSGSSVGGGDSEKDGDVDAAPSPFTARGLTAALTSWFRGSSGTTTTSTTTSTASASGVDGDREHEHAPLPDPPSRPRYEQENEAPVPPSAAPGARDTAQAMAAKGAPPASGGVAKAPSRPKYVAVPVRTARPGPVAAATAAAAAAAKAGLHASAAVPGITVARTKPAKK